MINRNKEYVTAERSIIYSHLNKNSKDVGDDLKDISFLLSTAELFNVNLYFAVYLCIRKCICERICSVAAGY